MERKRITGPDGCMEPLYSKLDIPPRRQNTEQECLKMRPLFLKAGTVKQANGSAYIELGHCKVMCAVYGPRPQPKLKGVSSMMGQVHCDVRFAPFALKSHRKAYGRDSYSKELSLIVQQAITPSLKLDTIPKSVVDVYVEILEQDGSSACLAAAVSCASMALADAGIEMYDIVAACSAGYDDTRLVLDCDTREEALLPGSLFISYMPSLNQISHMIQSGQAGVTFVSKAIECCIDACTLLYRAQSQALASTLKDTQ